MELRILNKTKDGLVFARCHCGVQFTVHPQDLLSGKVTSCGCTRKPVKTQYTNKKFNNLVILDPCLPKNRAEVICDCGNKFKTSLYNVLKNKTKSCGCIRKSGNPPPRYRTLIDNFITVDGTFFDLVLKKTTKMRPLRESRTVLPLYLKRSLNQEGELSWMLSVFRKKDK